MATTRPFRDGVHYLARGLFFVSFTALLAGGALVDTQARILGLWWLLIAGMVLALGFTAQYFSTPPPLQPITTTLSSWPWFLTAMVTLPWILQWIDWHGPWLVVLVLIAATMGVWASFLPVHRRAVIHQQYREDTASDITSTENVP